MVHHADPLRLAARRALARSLAPARVCVLHARADPGHIARVKKAVEHLPKPQRDIFLAVRLEDRSLREMAAQLRLTLAEAERIFAAALLAIHAARR